LASAKRNYHSDVLVFSSANKDQIQEKLAIAEYYADWPSELGSRSASPALEAMACEVGSHRGLKARPGVSPKESSTMAIPAYPGRKWVMVETMAQVRNRTASATSNACAENGQAGSRRQPCNGFLLHQDS